MIEYIRVIVENPGVTEKGNEGKGDKEERQGEKKRRTGNVRYISHL